MNLETLLDQRLWAAIRVSYESRQYSAAILDAIHFAADVIRTKSGIQTDGVALVGQAFGGKSPPLKVNKLQTETERSVQSGIEQLLKGVFQAFRNPRSHEKVTDSQADADAIILFVSYLLTIVDKTKSVYSKEAALASVFDKHFVESDRYADLLVEGIPAKHRLDILIEVFRLKETGDGRKLAYFVQSALSRISPEETQELLAAVGEQLAVADSEDEFRLTVQLLPSGEIARLPEIAKLRLENRLIQSVKQGDYNERKGLLRRGVLGTWLDRISANLVLQDELEKVIAEKMRSSDFDEHSYLKKYLRATMVRISDAPSDRMIIAFRHALRGGSLAAKEMVAGTGVRGESALAVALSKELSSFTAKKLSDDPFPDDDIPF